MKIVLIGFTIVLVVLCCGLAIRYNQDANHARGEFNTELYKRMVAEENLQKAAIQVDSLTEELARMKNRVEQAELVLEKTKLVNADLRLRLQKADQMREMLDRKIKELQALGL
ncbi:MAG TPA: hypothetical protein PKV41_04780 [Candidatus Omnitrophota bacterium]|nr:hypothetical protein [Candidatus Omnitrophota bacterium]